MRSCAWFECPAALKYKLQAHKFISKKIGSCIKSYVVLFTISKLIIKMNNASIITPLLHMRW